MLENLLTARARTVVSIGAALALIVTLLGVVTMPHAAAQQTVTTSSSANFGPEQAAATFDVTLDECDPVNGELLSVTLTLDSELEINYELENRGPAPADATVDANAALVLTGPAGTGLMGSGSVMQTVPLDTSDGVLDFGGPSGETGMVTADADDSQVYTAAAELAAYTGTGTIALPISFTGSVTTLFPGGNGFGGGTNLASGVVTLTCEYEVPLVPAISVEKSTNGDDADAAPGPTIIAGDAVTWTYVVTNTGETPLTNVVLTDDQIGAVTCPQDTLALGESMTCTAEGVAIEGAYVNNASVTGDGPGGEQVADTDPSNYLGVPPPVPAISVEKSTNGQDADAAPGPTILEGDPVTWTYVVTNTGETPLTNVALTDDQIGAVTCPQDTLALGESMTCTAEGVAIDGAYVNNASVTGDGPRGEEVSDADPSNYLGEAPLVPAISVEKSTNGQDADAAPGPTILEGDPVTWTYVVTNTGETPLTNVVLTDDQIGAVTCPQDTLALGESMTCTAEGVAIDGAYVNNASVTGEGPGGEEVSDADPSNYLGEAPPPPPPPPPPPGAPAISVEKSTNGQDADSAPGPTIAVGDPVTWTYVVTNIGDTELTNVALVDDQLGPITCPETTLAADEAMTCTAEGVAVEGPYVNEASVTGVGPNGEEVSDDDPSNYLGDPAPAAPAPAIDVEKSTNGEDADTGTGPTLATGADVTWTYVVTNTGNVPLTDVAVTDDQVGAIDCPQDELAVGEDMTCTAEGVAIEGPYTNIADATGVDPDGTVVQDDDPSRYVGRSTPGTPSINIEKSTNGVDADEAPGPIIVAGGLVQWNYVVTNDGDVDLMNIEVVDNIEGAIACPETALAVGESMTCTKQGIAAAGNYANVASVTGTDINDTTVFDSDPSHYEGAEAVDQMVTPPPPPAPAPAPAPQPAPAPAPVILPAPAPVILPAPVIQPAPVPVPAPVVKKDDGKKNTLAVTGFETLALSTLATALLGGGLIALGFKNRREDGTVGQH